MSLTSLAGSVVRKITGTKRAGKSGYGYAYEYERNKKRTKAKRKNKTKEDTRLRKKLTEQQKLEQTVKYAQEDVNWIKNNKPKAISPVSAEKKNVGSKSVADYHNKKEKEAVKGYYQETTRFKVDYGNRKHLKRLAGKYGISPKRENQPGYRGVGTTATRARLDDMYKHHTTSYKAKTRLKDAQGALSAYMSSQANAAAKQTVAPAAKSAVVAGIKNVTAAAPVSSVVAKPTTATTHNVSNSQEVARYKAEIY